MIKQEEEKVVKSNNLGDSYRFVNKRLSYMSPVGCLINDKGDIITSDEVKANMFNIYYASLSVQHNGRRPRPTGCSLAVQKPVETVVFNESSVIAAINKLKANLPAGPDGSPPILFKELKHSLTRPLALLYQQLLSVGSVPDDWKSAIITPVSKKRCSR